MSVSHSHLSDARLQELLDSGRPDTHMAVCPDCQARMASLSAFGRSLIEADEAAFARAFTDARVTASRDRILSAVAAQRSARVVPFPGAVAPAAPSLRARPRWMAAAAAGLIVGLALGRWTHWGGPMRPAPASVTQGQAVLQPAVQPVVYVPADDELLTAIESASLGPIAEVRSLHELTPLAGQYDPSW
jgi:hypothetical protein